MTLCECGCGEPTSIAKRTETRRGIVKGQPLRFAAAGHWLRTEEGKQRLLGYRWKGEEAGISPLHKWLRNKFTKTGVCGSCGKTCGTKGRGTGTEWAFRLHPEPYSRNRADYLELCRRCHNRIDRGLMDWPTKQPERAT